MFKTFLGCLLLSVSISACTLKFSEQEKAKVDTTAIRDGSYVGVNEMIKDSCNNGITDSVR